MNIEDIKIGSDRGIGICLTEVAAKDMDGPKVIELNTLKGVTIDKSQGFSILQIELNESHYVYVFPLVGIRKIVPVKIIKDENGDSVEQFEAPVYQMPE